MGLLDDAIREHLDLKRRRGADPADVARMEHEALGPVRRDPTPAEAAAEAQQADPPAAPPAEHHAAEHSDEHAHELAPEERHDPPHGDPLLEQHAHNVELGGAAAEREPSDADDDRAGGGEDARPPAEGPVGAPGGAGPGQTGPARQAAEPNVVDQPTTEYRVEDHHDDEDEPDEPPQGKHGHHEDVLEDTPDFLQETPEHDRLWFEQRPPRDFDFDG